MLKVFLVEDETIIREGLRDIIPWQQYGYILVGDAGDGEQALPMIRETGDPNWSGAVSAQADHKSDADSDFK